MNSLWYPVIIAFSIVDEWINFNIIIKFEITEALVGSARNFPIYRDCPVTFSNLKINITITAFLWHIGLYKAVNHNEVFVERMDEYGVTLRATFMNIEMMRLEAIRGRRSKNLKQTSHGEADG